jgi:hypothetical protein
MEHCLAGKLEPMISHDATWDDGAGPALSARDGAALEALVESGYATDRVGPEHRDRAQRLVQVLGLLDGGGASDPALVDATMARIARATARARIAPLAAESELVPDDQEALDAWVIAGYQTSRVAGSLRERAKKHEALAALVRGPAALGEASDLIERTLARVQAAAVEQEGRMILKPGRGWLGRGGRWADVVSVAAMLLIGVSVVWPMVTTTREASRKYACEARMGETGLAFGSYASSNREALPVASASMAGGGGAWWDVGKGPGHSNSSNLFTLVKDGYTSLVNLACPGNAEAQTVAQQGRSDWESLPAVSYSYQIMFGPSRPQWKQPDQTVVIADRSPVVLASVRGEFVDPFSNSPNHRGATVVRGGQYVLMNDGSARWLTSPKLASGDNIWLPRVVEQALEQIMSGRKGPIIQGTETPQTADDVFLGP